ncbi:MAG: AraC family transcriptional regulator [Fusicatenibacter sp.]|nr:AraC family transcriptional regulator [Lachnospiraceae bacterium]MDY2938964.1 AraC family transcriptional regulator [Fusicatenibacter sp.]
MDIVEYEPINLYDGRFCKVFHSDIIEKEKPKNVNDPPHFHWHNSFEFNCSIQGSLKCEVGSSVCYVNDFDFLFVNPNVIHKSLEITKPFLGFAVLVPASIIHQFFDRNEKNPSVSIDTAIVNQHRKTIMNLLMDICKYSRSEDPAALLGMNACVLQIFYLLLSGNAGQTQKNSKTASDDSMPFTEYLSAHYKEHISLESVSEHFGFSPAYFSRIFTKKTGRNFNVYLSTLRLNHATHLLENTESLIPDIAEESGFSSSRSFIEMFKKVNGVTPKQFRDQCNENKKNNHSDD